MNAALVVLQDGLIVSSPNGFRHMYAYDNPVTVRDPSGKCPPCLVGALIGAAGGGLFAYGAQVWTHSQDPNFKGNPWTDQIDGAVIGGGIVAGAVTGVTLGAGTFFEVGGGGAALLAVTGGVEGGQIGRMTENGLHGLAGKPMTARLGDLSDELWDGGLSLLGEGAGRLLGPPLKRAVSGSILPRVLNRTGGPIVPVNEGTGQILLRSSTGDTTVGSGLANVAEGSSIPPSYPPSTDSGECHVRLPTG